MTATRRTKATVRLSRATSWAWDQDRQRHRLEMTPCLDHQPTRDANGKPLPAVTGKHYNYAQRKNMEAKRKVLDRWAAEPRRIVGTPSWQSRPGSRRPPTA